MHRALPARPDLDHYRKEAKVLLRAYRDGEQAAVGRAVGVLGEPARGRFLLSDAQYVIAAEHAHRSWSAVRRSIEVRRAAEARGRLEQVGAALAAARHGWGEEGEAVLDSGVSYRPGEPVRIIVRKRGYRYHIGDRGESVRKAGRPRGWLELAQRVAAEDGFNANRAGVVFVGVVEGRDIALLAVRLADTCLAVYGDLLDATDPPGGA